MIVLQLFAWGCEGGRESPGQIGDAGYTDARDSCLAILDSSDEAARLRAVAQLALWPVVDPGVVGGLLAALDDEAKPVREMAAFGLGYAGSEGGRAIPELEDLLGAQSVSERDYASGALAQLAPDHPSVSGALLAALKDPNAGVRLNAVHGLGRAGRALASDKEVASALTSLLEDESLGVRYEAAWALSRVLGRSGAQWSFVPEDESGMASASRSTPRGRVRSCEEERGE